MDQTAQAPDYAAYSQDIQSKIPPEFQEAFQRLVVAGMKFMFSPQSQQMIDDGLQQDQQTPVGELIGQFVAGVMVTMLKQSRGAPPGEMLIPAGVELVIQAAKYVEKAGYRQVTANDLGMAIQTFIYKIVEQFGATGEQFDAVMDKMGSDAQARQTAAQPKGMLAGE